MLIFRVFLRFFRIFLFFFDVINHTRCFKKYVFFSKKMDIFDFHDGEFWVQKCEKIDFFEQIPMYVFQTLSFCHIPDWKINAYTLDKKREKVCFFGPFFLTRFLKILKKTWKNAKKRACMCWKFLEKNMIFYYFRHSYWEKT